MYRPQVMDPDPLLGLQGPGTPSERTARAAWGSVHPLCAQARCVRPSEEVLIGPLHRLRP